MHTKETEELWHALRRKGDEAHLPKWRADMEPNATSINEALKPILALLDTPTLVRIVYYGNACHGHQPKGSGCYEVLKNIRSELDLRHNQQLEKRMKSLGHTIDRVARTQGEST